MGMGVSLKHQLTRAQRERDEHKAAAIVFYQIACDLCGTLAVKAEYEKRVAEGKSVKPDDQQNAGDDGSTNLRHHASDGRLNSEDFDLAKTDNGVGVTSAGGESGLPHRAHPRVAYIEGSGFEARWE